MNRRYRGVNWLAPLAGLIVLALFYWDYQVNLEQARENFRTESHHLASIDRARLSEVVRLLQTALKLVGEDKYVHTFIAAGGGLPPNSQARITPAFELLSSRLKVPSLYILEFTDEEVTKVVFRANSPNFSPERFDEAELQKLSELERGSLSPDQFTAVGPFPISKEGELGLIYAFPIVHDEEVVGGAALVVLCEQMVQGSSERIEAIREVQSQLLIAAPNFGGKGGIYQEMLSSEGLSWELSASRPDSQFWSRSDVHSARRTAAVGVTSVLLAVALAVLWSSRRSALAASQAKGDFLATISHEIRTPLSGIMSLSKLAQATPLDPLQREYMSTVSDTAQSLLGLVHDTLDMSRIEAGILDLKPVPTDLRRLLHSAAKTLAPGAAKKGLNLVCWIEPDVPERVLVDPLRLTQSLINLAGNAVKFTDNGEVTIRVSKVAKGLRFVVRDTGRGIPATDLEAVFDPYRQVRVGERDAQTGTGLGLFITKEIVADLGGALDLQSGLGKGTVFWFTLNLPVCESDSLPVPEGLAQTRLVILEEQNTHYQRLLSVLESWGFSPERAVTPSSLTQLGEPAGVILCTASSEALERAKSTGWKVLVMLQMDGESAKWESRCQEAGFSTLLKPFSEADLMQKLAEVSLGHEQPALATGPLLPALPALKILLAEDSPIHQRFTTRMLQSLGHEVLLAPDGEQALQLATSVRPDIVLLDMRMPKLDGLEVAQRLRSWEREQDVSRIPVLALTANALGADKDRCLKAGVDAYLPKPYEDRVLLELIRELLPKARESGPRPVQAPRPNGVQFEPEASLRRVGGDPWVLQELIEFFAETAPDLVANLGRAAEAGEAEVVRRHSQTLSGMVRVFGARELLHRLDAVQSSKDEALPLSELEAMVEDLRLELLAFSQRTSQGDEIAT